MGRNIVLCFDGTSNQVDANYTNVLRLFSCLVNSADQVTYYDCGVGTQLGTHTLSRWYERLRQWLDLAAGDTVRENVIEAYVFLMQNYRDGDRIFLFGYSRGAYTARALAGLVFMFGLFRPEHANLVPYAWRRFWDNTVKKGTAEEKRLFRIANRFKRLFAQRFARMSGKKAVTSYDVPIHFLGAFDTVSSFGLFWRYRTLPFTRRNKLIQHCRHAMAIDEKRAHFAEEHVEARYPARQDYKEVWFAGVHSDVGGGRSNKQSGLAKVALSWILGEAVALGLQVDPKEAAFQTSGADPAAPRAESLTTFWRCAGIIPLRRWDDRRKRLAWFWPNFVYLRPIAADAHVHRSVFDRWKEQGYWPQNMPDDDSKITWVE